MSPLQRIAMGLVIVFLPAYFPAHPSPEWAFYDFLPDPLGWAMVLWGLSGLRSGSDLDLTLVRWLGVLAFLVSLPLWLPQVNHLLVPKYNPDIDVSFQWFLSLPQLVFSLALAREIGQAAVVQQPRDRFVAGRFGVLVWGFGVAIVLPVAAYGVPVEQLEDPATILIGLVDLIFIYYLFRVHRREWLGGPGPLRVGPGTGPDPGSDPGSGPGSGRERRSRPPSQ